MFHPFRGHYLLFTANNPHLSLFYALSVEITISQGVLISLWKHFLHHAGVRISERHLAGCGRLFLFLLTSFTRTIGAVLGYSESHQKIRE